MGDIFAFGFIFMYVCLQNDFNFERRDWMDVSPDELPEGSQLVRSIFLRAFVP